MDPMVLSPKELLVLSAEMGARSFYGLHDPFRGMTKNEMQIELPKIQLQLEKKGLASLGFDDSFTLTALSDDMFPTCVWCDQYITLDTYAAGKLQPRTLLYFREGEIVSVYESAAGLELRKSSRDEAVSNLISFGFANGANTAAEAAGYTITQVILKNIQGKEPKEVLDILHGDGCPAAIAYALVLSLRQECEYYSLIATDLKKGALQNILCITVPDGNIRITLNDEEDTWQAVWISKDDICVAVESIINGYCMQ